MEKLNLRPVLKAGQQGKLTDGMWGVRKRGVEGTKAPALDTQSPNHWTPALCSWSMELCS